METMEKQILNLIAAKGALDRKRYEKDLAYRQIYDALAATIERNWRQLPENVRREDRLSSFVVFALVSWGEVGENLSVNQAMKDAQSAYMARLLVDQISGTDKWKDAEKLHDQIKVYRRRIHSSRLTKHVEPFESLTQGRTTALVMGYTLALAIVMPLAAGMVILIWDQGHELPEVARDLVSLLFALMVAYPLDGVNRMVGTVRVPRVHPVALPLLLIVAGAAFLEYQYVFLGLPHEWGGDASWLEWEAFWHQMKYAASERWLFLAPFVAIALTLLNRSGFIYPADKHMEEILNNLSDTPVMAFFIGLVSVVLALLLRGLLALAT